MSVFNDSDLREIIREELKAVMRQELGQKPAAAGDYISVSEAAQIASVQVQTIRAWMRSGKLKEYRAGRVLRARRSDLEDFLAKGPDPGPESNASPEELADLRLQQRLRDGRRRAKW